LLFLDISFQFIKLALFLDDFIKLRIHGVFSSDIGLNCLNLLQNFLLIVLVIPIELIVVGLYAVLQQIQYFFAHTRFDFSRVQRLNSRSLFGLLFFPVLLDLVDQTI
jgi:hypothetical protein